jgi:hypothetical protein
VSYTPPAGNAANVSWVGVAAYTPPAGGAANVSWAPTGPAGTGAGILGFTGAGAGVHGVSGAGAGVLVFSGGGTGEHGFAPVLGTGAGELGFAGAGAGRHGVAGAGAGVLGFAGAGAGAHGVAGAGAGAVAFAGSGLGVHQRYEVRGEVRLSGVLVNRRVRCSKRATGELMGQADTVDGRYRVHAGFDAAEVYMVAIDLSGGATDWVPAAANRLVPVLADDAAP